MSYTLEITLWCEYPGCFEWIQFNHADAQGSPLRARLIASQHHGWTRKRMKDLCPKQHVAPLDRVNP